MAYQAHLSGTRENSEQHEALTNSHGMVLFCMLIHMNLSFAQGLHAKAEHRAKQALVILEAIPDHKPDDEIDVLLVLAESLGNQVSVRFGPQVR